MGKRIAIGMVVAAAVLAAAYFSYQRLFASGDAPADGPADAAPVVARSADANAALPVVVTAVAGTVERRDLDTWVAVQEGEKLDPDAVLRTGFESKAMIDVASTMVELDSETQVSVPRITAAVSQIRLGQGRVSANVSGDRAGKFAVLVDNSDAVAETEQGQFSVITDGEGKVSVDVADGKVRLTSKEKTVEVGAGQESIVFPDAPPTEPRAIPGALFLKVHRPGGVRRAKKIAVRGSTEPGAVIKVNGRIVQVGADGLFVTSVALREGKNTVSVLSRDAYGRTKSKSVNIRVDSRGPNVGVKVKWKRKR